MNAYEMAELRKVLIGMDHADWTVRFDAPAGQWSEGYHGFHITTPEDKVVAVCVQHADIRTGRKYWTNGINSACRHATPAEALKEGLEARRAMKVFDPPWMQD